MKRFPLDVLKIDRSFVSNISRNTADRAVAEAVVRLAAGFKMHHTISCADAFAAATADGLEAILVTGDLELGQLEDRIEIEMLERMHR